MSICARSKATRVTLIRNSHFSSLPSPETHFPRPPALSHNPQGKERIKMKPSGARRSISIKSRSSNFPSAPRGSFSRIFCRCFTKARKSAKHVGSTKQPWHFNLPYPPLPRTERFPEKVHPVLVLILPHGGILLLRRAGFSIPAATVGQNDDRVHRSPLQSAYGSFSSSRQL